MKFTDKEANTLYYLLDNEIDRLKQEVKDCGLDPYGDSYDRISGLVALKKQIVLVQKLGLRNPKK